MLLDPPDRQGRAAPADPLDDARLATLRSALREVWPRQATLIQRWSMTTEEVPRSRRPAAAALHVSGAFTDVRRLADLPLGRCSRVVVLRQGALLLPATALQDLLEQAHARDLDVAVIAGIPPDLCYVVSDRTLTLLASVSDVPGAATVPQVVERLAAAAAGTRPLATTSITPTDTSWLRRAGAVAASVWRAPPAAALLAQPSGQRLAALIAMQQASFADAHAAVMRHRPARHTARRPDRRPDRRPGEGAGRRPRGGAGDAARVRVLVVLPSMFQTGAHAAWAELSSALAPSEVAFVVGRETVLADLLRDRGFAVHEVTEGLVPGSGAGAAVLLDAIEAIRPSVVHLDGAESNAWAGMLHAHGLRIVVHVRLNDAERFRPSFLYADAIVGVSDHLYDEIAVRVGTAVRVAHIPDGVWLESRAEASSCRGRPDLRADGTEVVCLCVGRIEPAKNQLRILDIFNALSAHVPCRLVIIGPCGGDAAYGDEVCRRLRSMPTAEWRPFTFPLTDLYRRAHVVLVGSRNEALGMVGLETLAAGALLVAQRSVGYERIIDPAQREGILFDRGDSPDAVASRIVAALGDFGTYSGNARRKAAECFDARTCAERLMRLWQDVADVGQ